MCTVCAHTNTQKYIKYTNKHRLYINTHILCKNKLLCSRLIVIN